LKRQRMMYEDAKVLSRHNFIEKYGGHSEWVYDKVHGELIREILKQSLESIDNRKEKERQMSKVNDLLIQMEEEAPHITKTAFVGKYGWIHEDVWTKVRIEMRDQLGLELEDED